MPFSVDISNNFTSWVDRNGSQLWVSGYIWGALDITTHSTPGSIPGRQLECWRWLQQLTSLQIFTIYTALEKHVYIAASMLDILHLPQNLSFYLPSPSHKQQQVDRQTDCWMWFFWLSRPHTFSIQPPDWKIFYVFRIVKPSTLVQYPLRPPIPNPNTQETQKFNMIWMNRDITQY